MVRSAARVLLLDDRKRLLLLHARRPSDGFSFWIFPGGGLLRGEDFETAARRETHEETGVGLVLGPCIWTRSHSYEWDGVIHHQYERFFLGHALGTEIRPSLPDTFVLSHRWWTLEQIEASSEVFAPSNLLLLLPPILQGKLPDPPTDCSG
jgi:8-oxo-dGTP pyrophosphatase MutT (NUDIX family)